MIAKPFVPEGGVKPFAIMENAAPGQGPGRGSGEQALQGGEDAGF